MTPRAALFLALLAPFACDVADDDPEHRDAHLAIEDAEDDDDASCGADLMRVDPGEHAAGFHAVSPQTIELDPSLDFTIDPDGTTMHADNGPGVTLVCRCEDNCSGGTSFCTVSLEESEATCGGECSKADGGVCGGCAFHHVPPPRDSVPGAKKPALPGGGQNALP